MLITTDISTLNSMAEPRNPQSFCIKGEINKQQIQVLIDGGSTNNFINPKLAKHLQLSATTISPFHVYIGNGDSLACNSCCHNVPLSLPGTRFDVNFYALHIQGPDLVLGVQWLQGLGSETHNYADLTMEFNWNGQNIALQGNQSLTP